MSSSVVRPGQVIADRYRVERWLGQGGMGSVYRAVQLSVQRTVALKRLVDEHLANASHVERFEREALALSRLSHPSTVRLFDFGTDERGCPFIVMEYLEGVDLATDLERHGTMRWDHALQVSLRVLGSLDEAHAAGIVHRDVKPANLFLCTGPDWPIVKVLDFGIAGGAEPSADARKLTLTGTVLGSAPYMSPEQARGMKVTPAADLYSFGVVLFEMLTGKTPFQARSLTAQLLAKVLQPAPALADVCPELDAPAELHALVAALLERDPARRPASAQATAATISALLARASLPALSRAAQPANRTRPGIARTEPMLLPHTIDEGWSPPRVLAGPPATRSRAGLVWAALLAASVAGAGVWMSSPRPEPEPLAPIAALRPSATSAENTSAAEPMPEAPVSRLDAGVDSEPSVAAGPEEQAASPRAQGSIRAASRELGATESSSAPATRGEQEPSPRAKNPGAPQRSQSRGRASRRPTAEVAAAPPAAISAAPAGAAPAETAPAETAPAATAPSVATAPAAIDPSTAASSAPALSPDVLLPETPDRPPPGAVILPETLEPEIAQTEPRAATSAGSSGPDGAGATVQTPPILGSPATWPVATDPRYWTIAAARSAARHGEITPAQRNEIVAALQQRRLKARARAARAYRQGRIGLEELLERQRDIDRRIDGW